MRLLSLTVRNYRIHRELTIEFDAARHLIGGANETGKSTLAEAMHRALFLRYKTGGELQKSMVSGIHSGAPEVKLAFEAAGDVWTIEKEFSGTKGKARLTSRSGISLQGDAAEEKLAEVTANADGVANRENDLITRWAHLWVWQGTAGNDAASFTTDHRNELIQRLQEQGLAAVMQSAHDERTREAIREKYDKLFTKTGTVKTGSPLDSATKALAEASARLDAATQQKSRLEAAIREQESATRTLAESTAALPGLREQLVSTSASFDKANALRTKQEHQQLLHTQAVAALQEWQKNDQLIHAYQAQAVAARTALAPAEEQLALLADRVATAASKAATARTEADAVATALRLARQHHDLAQACVTYFEKNVSHQKLVEQSRDIARIEQELGEHRAALSELPVISPSQLDSLRALESQLAAAKSALSAIATAVELIASPQTVLLDQQALTVGSTQIITENAELSLADGTRLRIKPGGGNSLAGARRTVEDLQQQLTTTLDQLAIACPAEAAEIVGKRQALEQKITAIQSRLKDLGARDLPEALASAASALASASHEMERRRDALAHAVSLPIALATALDWLKETRAAQMEAEQKEQILRAEETAAEQIHQEKLTTHQRAQQSLEAQRGIIADRETSARTLEEMHGDATTRAQAIAEAMHREAAAKSQLATTQSALQELNPARLPQELERLQRVIRTEEDKQQDARTRIAVAQQKLASDGTTDPDADLLRAKARHASAHEEHAREQRHVDAIALLQKLFTESQKSISRSVTQPIADRVADYLECLYGRGVKIEVVWGDAAASSQIRITRPGAPTFSFDSLSGGAKEQVAAAVRLAMAEILASSHHGCLPILFDDSFAYSDDERVQSLQSMLDLAATRGLQVIVLTCTPAAYIGLGARETRLTSSISA